MSYPSRYKNSAAWKSYQAKNKPFFEVPPIRTTALQIVWLKALVLSQGMNCHLQSLTVCMEIFFLVLPAQGIFENLQLDPVSSSKSSRLFDQ